jgi:hypothetical protein
VSIGSKKVEFREQLAQVIFVSLVLVARFNQCTKEIVMLEGGFTTRMTLVDKGFLTNV